MSKQIFVCEKKLLQFEGKKVVKTLKNKVGCYGNAVEPLYFCCS